MSTSFPEARPYQYLISFFALSRTPHGVIDMTAPVMAALLYLGHFPPVPIIMVGLITVFSGYTAVYALNDLVDIRIDKEKMRLGGYHETETDLDGVLIRHPLAKGTMSYSAGLAWTGFWAVTAMAGAYWLNPVCLVLFLAGALLETVYCKLFQVTPLRTMINGIVKAIGSLAAVVAVAPEPPLFFLGILFFWIFFWEIGGQNIPNDWSDIEEDRLFNARTVPLSLGLHRAGLMVIGCLSAAFLFHMVLLWTSILTFNVFLMLIAAASNYYLLLHPGFLLSRRKNRHQAMVLFNRASYYPLVTLLLVLCAMIPPTL